ncbi:hypothetical protein GCM10010170_077840 [Dactylosporangium salmoneum]|uniref:Uncharacterized protein n=1 Tax=Dactylosporangium salmoneum TaxID=53361 RepID=A0ABN3HB21_9ACTN
MFSVVALVLFSVLVGAVVGQRWEAGQERSRQAAEASLFLAVAGLDSVTGSDGRVTIEGSIAVTNGSPMPVEVTGADKAADVMVRGQQRIAPAATGWFPVSATVTCVDGATAMPVPVGLSVATADGARRTVTLELQLNGSRWYEFVVQGCAPRWSVRQATALG